MTINEKWNFSRYYQVTESEKEESEREKINSVLFDLMYNSHIQVRKINSKRAISFSLETARKISSIRQLNEQIDKPKRESNRLREEQKSKVSEDELRNGSVFKRSLSLF